MRNVIGFTLLLSPFEVVMLLRQLLSFISEGLSPLFASVSAAVDSIASGCLHVLEIGGFQRCNVGDIFFLFDGSNREMMKMKDRGFVQLN